MDLAILALVIVDRALNVVTFALVGTALVFLVRHAVTGGKFTPE